MATFPLYLDEMFSKQVALGLGHNHIEVIMAKDVGMRTFSDDLQLAYVIAHRLILVTFDKAFAGRCMKRADHFGVICWTGRQDDIGGQVSALSEFVQTHDADEVAGQVFWLK